MPNDAEQLSFNQLCALADLPRRTVRFYIDEGLVERPLGAKRGAYYTQAHLDRLLAIRGWQRAGVNLRRIRELLVGPAEGEMLPPERARQPGDVSLRSHIHLAPGVDLVIEAKEAGLSPEAVHGLARQAASFLDNLKKETPR